MLYNLSQKLQDSYFIRQAGNFIVKVWGWTKHKGENVY